MIHVEKLLSRHLYFTYISMHQCMYIIVDLKWKANALGNLVLVGCLVGMGVVRESWRHAGELEKWRVAAWIYRSLRMYS